MQKLSNWRKPKSVRRKMKCPGTWQLKYVYSDEIPTLLLFLVLSL